MNALESPRLTWRQKATFLCIIGLLSFAVGLLVARRAAAEEYGLKGDGAAPAPAGDSTASPFPASAPIAPAGAPATGGKGPGSRVVYPKNSKVDFEGMSLQGEVRNPGEFYFQRRPEEKFDSLVKRRKNFHKEMLRDVVISK